MLERLLIAGTHSGVGKTTIVVGLIAALRQRGHIVQPFKVGPDYIDPTFHTLAAGRSCRNLDAWMLSPERLCSLFTHSARGADLAVVEGVMGLYDGLGYEEELASTAQVSKLLKAPVLLVIDAGKMARSAGALALGFQRFDQEVSLAGFIVNRVGSAKHGQGVARAIEGATGLPVLGWLPRTSTLHVPERPLGLTPSIGPGPWGDYVQAAAAAVSEHLDLESILGIVRRQGAWKHPVTEWDCRSSGLERPRIAVARDEAFHFLYAENLELLEASGADLAYFSPLNDQQLPEGTAGILLSGGFPELQAKRLAANSRMHASLREAHAHGLPIYAECGGLMYLTESIVTAEGHSHPMVGLLPGRSVMSERLKLGYREVEAVADSWLFSAGETVRGHEFHYSQWEGRPENLSPAFSSCAAESEPEGACLGNLWASYIHLHFWGKPVLAERFVAACCRKARHGSQEAFCHSQAGGSR